MRLKKGDRVKHPNLPERGLGEVLEDSNGDTVRIFFVGVGEKTLSLKHVQPVKVSKEEGVHPVLDNLKIKKTKSGIKYQSLPDSIQKFLVEYPEGFYGERIKNEERDYKVEAHNLSLELLGKKTFSSLIGQKNYEEIKTRALIIVNKTNLIFPNEKMSFRDGLASAKATQNFSLKLFDLLYGKGELKGRFEAFSNFLIEINAAKWTTATYFLFIHMPDKYMFLKPKAIQNVTELCGYEINYRSDLNWLTYKLVLDFSNYLYEELSELKPRDMIDIQTFMYCILPNT